MASRATPHVNAEFGIWRESGDQKLNLIEWCQRGCEGPLRCLNGLLAGATALLLGRIGVDFLSWKGGERGGHYRTD